MHFKTVNPVIVSTGTTSVMIHYSNENICRTMCLIVMNLMFGTGLEQHEEE